MSILADVETPDMPTGMFVPMLKYQHDGHQHIHIVPVVYFDREQAVRALNDGHAQVIRQAFDAVVVPTDDIDLSSVFIQEYDSPLDYGHLTIGQIIANPTLDAWEGFVIINASLTEPERIRVSDGYGQLNDVLVDLNQIEDRMKEIDVAVNRTGITGFFMSGLAGRRTVRMVALQPVSQDFNLVGEE